jgi:uncharacterized protein (TIGR02246 family)
VRGFSGAIEDRLAIRERIESYNDAVFRHDADDWAECWAEDAQWNVAGYEASGRTAIRDLWVKLMANYAQVSMFVNHGALAIDGDQAESRCYIIEMQKKQDGGEMLLSGRYDDRLKRDGDGAWRFVSRSYTVLHVKG